MLIRRPKPWQLPESETTAESTYHNRRQLLRNLGYIGLGTLLARPASAGLLDLFGKEKAASPFSQRALTFSESSDFQAADPLTKEATVLSYNNFYEFGTAKSDPVENAQSFKVDPWQLTIDGEVENPVTLSYDDIYGQSLEQRIYRLRCVEAWSMVIPWVGFPLASLLAKAKPLSSARYVAMQTLNDPDQMPGVKSRFLGGGISFPYVEGLRMDEAQHPLTFMAVGVYGKTLPPQNGAPLRLVVPWKYGFKSIKSIVKISLVREQPPTTWNLAAANEYGFYANVNPEVDHPRWSQGSERRIVGGGIGSDKRIPTQAFNGYGEEVAQLYKGMDLTRQF